MTEKLKIAFYTDSFLPAIDGVVISILNFKKELEKRGNEVYIYASGNEKTRQMTKGDKHITVIRSIRFNKYPQYNLALFPLSSRFKLDHVKVDINHAQTPFMMGIHALMLSKFERTPIVGSFHTMFTDKSVIKDYAINSDLVAEKIIKYSWKYARLYYNRCDAVAAPSNTIKTMLERRRIENVDLIPNGVDIKKFNPKVNGEIIRRRLTDSDREKLVMYVGRISREKKLETLIKAAKLLKNEKVRVAIVGTGPATSYYQHMVERMHLKDKVRFAGFVSNEDLPSYYAACDVFCIPSTFETQGVVSLEAMASGKPVVGADYLALKELIVNGKNGEKFRPNDGKACADKLEKVINNMSTYKEMVNTAKRYSIERTTDDLLALYRRVLNNASS
jgi:1,2-diacylglycerol 3-alpha-glucosyltransferase